MTAQVTPEPSSFGGAVNDQDTCHGMVIKSKVPDAFFRWMVQQGLARELKVPAMGVTNDDLDRQVDTEGKDALGRTDLQG